MYRVSPLTYLVSALLSTGLAGNPVQCSDLELLRFQPANGTTCEEYMAPYMEIAGGRLTDSMATDSCAFCPLSSTDVFLTSVNSFYNDRWENFGIFWAYIVFNIAASLAVYWLVRVPKHKGFFS